LTWASPFFRQEYGAFLPKKSVSRRRKKNYLDARKAFEEGITTIKLPEYFPEYLYITVDVDGLDPSVIPATGTPEPGGLGWYQLLSMVESAAAQREIIGFDVVELAPLPLQGFQASDFAAARLVYNIMGITARSLSLREKNGTEQEYYIKAENKIYSSIYPSCLSFRSNTDSYTYHNYIQ
jgi:agmatinase